MGMRLRVVAALGLVAVLGLPASGQSEHCTSDRLSIDGITVTAGFCVPAQPAASVSVSVSETFTAHGKTVSKTTPLAVMSGARVSRMIDDVDLTALGVKSTLHMTLAYRAGSVELEHALALPGAIPVK